MRVVTIRNTKLLEALNEYSQYVLANFNKIRKRDFELGSKGISWKEVCSEEYLHKRMKLDPLDTAFPHHLYGIDSNMFEKRVVETLPDILEKNQILDDSIMNAIGIGFCALKAIYPKEGYIDWHNNCNCPGQNLIMSYSTDGDGWFKYYDMHKKEIVTMHDKPGWTAKVGYYGEKSESDKIVWHCAKTTNPRITVSYVVRDQSMWEDMV